MERQAVAKTQKSAARSNPLQTQATRPTSAAHPMMELQRSIGNQAVQRLIRSPYIQTKLQVGTRRDRFGPEASHTAEKVMRSPAGPSGGGPIIQRKCACDGEEECAGCQERKLVQRQALGGAEQTSLPASVREVMQSGGGAALPKATQDHMESALGADLGGVRVHTDSQAARAAQDIKAEAFTVGQNIYFGAGRYQPTTTGGQRLLAHELTHTMQQWNGPVAAARAGLSVSQPSEPQELEAEAVANRVVSGDFVNRTAMQSSSAARQIQRYSWDEFVGDVENVGKAVSEGAETVSQAVGGGAEAVGEAVQGGAAAVGGAVTAGVAAVQGATSWILTEAGQLAVSEATALAGLLGGTVKIVGTGIMISIPDVELCTPRSIPLVTLPMMSVHIPLWGWAGVFGPIGVGAAAGIRLGIQPSLAVSYGPCRLQHIGLILDPIKGLYAGTAQLYIAGAVTETATLEGALKAIGVIGLFSPPIALMAGVEGGLRGTLRGIGAGAIEETVTVGYIGGAWALNLDSALMIGGALELDLDFFANAQLYNFVVCEYVLPLASMVLASAGERYELPLSVSSGGVSVGPVTSKPIPFSDIEVFVNRTRPETRCLSLDEIIGELCKRGYLPPELCEEEGEPATGLAGSCVANDNLDEVADSFISRCCKASIRREFPSELLNETLGNIKKGKTAAHKKAWKLLNDNRFKKPTASAATVACPVPVKYKQTAGRDAGGGVLHFEYAWESSTSNTADLKDCEVGEIVTYAGPSPFVWPKPPWDGATPNPTEIWLPGQDGGLQDDHSSTPFVTPYKEAAFIATQHYRYRTPCANSGNPVNLMGPTSIGRAVKLKRDGKFKYVITKSGKSASIDPLP